MTEEAFLRLTQEDLEEHRALWSEFKRARERWYLGRGEIEKRYGLRRHFLRWEVDMDTGAVAVKTVTEAWEPIRKTDVQEEK